MNLSARVCYTKAVLTRDAISEKARSTSPIGIASYGRRSSDRRRSDPKFNLISFKVGDLGSVPRFCFLRIVMDRLTEPLVTLLDQWRDRCENSARLPLVALSGEACEGGGVVVDVIFAEHSVYCQLVGIWVGFYVVVWLRYVNTVPKFGSCCLVIPTERVVRVWWKLTVARSLFLSTSSGCWEGNGLERRFG